MKIIEIEVTLEELNILRMSLEPDSMLTKRVILDARKRNESPSSAIDRADALRERINQIYEMNTH